METVGRREGPTLLFYYDIDTVISWDTRPIEAYIGFLGTENRPFGRPASVQHFFRPATDVAAADERPLAAGYAGGLHLCR